jgi:hypothetical protein
VPPSRRERKGAALPPFRRVELDGERFLPGRVPEPGSFNARLAAAIKIQDARMAGTGYCATAVQRALAAIGLPQFLGSGNAWDMLGPLKRSGKFVQIPAGEATVGDIIVRPPSANPYDNSKYGDISVITAKKGNTLIQTNDATYAFRPDNPRYDGRAVFLRYVGQERDEQLAKRGHSKRKA